MKSFSLNNSLGNLLRELRIKKDWSVRKAGEVTGISYPTISNFENGVHSTSKNPIKPSPEQLKKLAAAYDYPYNLLMIKAGYGEFVENEEPELNVNELMKALRESINTVKPISTTELYTDEYFDSLEKVSIKEPIKEWKTISKSANETIGKRIKQIRDIMGVSINRLSDEMTGIFKVEDYEIHKKYPPHYIQSVEDNIEEPTSSFLIGFSDYFDVSIEWLLTGKGYPGDGAENRAERLELNDYKEEFKDITMEVIMKNMDAIIKEAEHRSKMKKPPY
jgi:transcriptional regulator with XRE-family HTH domain